MTVTGAVQDTARQPQRVPRPARDSALSLRLAESTGVSGLCQPECRVRLQSDLALNPSHGRIRSHQMPYRSTNLNCQRMRLLLLMQELSDARPLTRSSGNAMHHWCIQRMFGKGLLAQALLFFNDVSRLQCMTQILCCVATPKLWLRFLRSPRFR